MNELLELGNQITPIVYSVVMLWGTLFLILDKTRFFKLNPTWRKYSRNIGIVLGVLLMSIIILSLILGGINNLLK